MKKWGFRCRTIMVRAIIITLALSVFAGDGKVRAVDVSPPPILQWFESSYKTIENRTPDLFKAGYGAVWTPPPFRSDTSDFSVGYDVYDRFDLGKTGKPTLYGTETGLKSLTGALHRSGIDWHVDFVLNHNGYSDLSKVDGNGHSFYSAGGYPGMAISLPYDPNDSHAVDGDFHSAYWGGAYYERLAGLIDVAHETNYQFIRSPVDSNDSRNIRPGTQEAFGRIANLPDPNNARFYPDRDGPAIFVFDPHTGEQNIPVYSFNQQNPLAGDATPENVMGYLMRNAQWLVQTIGADGLRIDAAKHVQGFTLDYLDRAIYRQNPRNMLNGEQKDVFSYTETYDGGTSYLQTFVQKNIDHNNPGRIGANRDTLDFNMYFALKQNLESTAMNNAWQNIKNAGMDVADDGLHNGSSGVTFIQSHDVYKPYALADVATAYTLMMPGNTVVYFNGKEFGDNRDFPKDGRGDALSVGNGGSLTTHLLEARETHGRGNYAERWDGSDGLFAFERVSSALVLLSNRGDAGFDSRTFHNVGFAPGTLLVELSGNAADPYVNPERTDQFGNHFKDIPEVIQVFDNGNGDNAVNVRFQRPSTIENDGSFNFHGKGLLVYGLPTPQSNSGLEISNVSQVLAGNSNPTNNYQNGTQRQSDVKVITGNSFNARLLTHEVRLLGSDALRDIYADGDFSAIKVDGGIDLNHNGYVDFTTPGSAVYGFENWGTTNNPLIGHYPGVPHGDFGAPRGNGEFIQTIDATQLSEGYHFIEARAFRYRTDGGPEVFSTWKETVYVDRLKPVSAFDSAHPFSGAGNNDLWFKSLDMTASDVNVFLNLPANLNDVSIKAMADGGQGHLDPIDRDIFKTGVFGVPNGNNVFTVVTYEITGNYNIQRITGQQLSNSLGGGLGDLNFDGFRNPDDIANSVYGFEHFLHSKNNEFNPAGDITGDGKIDTYDLLALDDALIAGTAPQSSLDEWRGVMFRRVNFQPDAVLNYSDLLALRSFFGLSSGPNLWTYDLTVDGIVNQADEALMISAFGVVPEPSSSVFASIGVWVMFRLRRHCRRRMR